MARDGRPIHADQRALARLVVGSVKARERAIERVASTKLREEIFTFQLAVAGNANAIPLWQPADVQFPSPMVPAPAQRDSDLEVPQFWQGAHLYSSGAPVVIFTHVRDWLTDDADYTTGAVVNIGAYTPGENANVEFAGYVHLTFQGFSAPVLDDEDGEA